MTRHLTLLALLVLLTTPAWAQGGGRSALADPDAAPDSAQETPDSLRQVGFDQNLGEQLPLDAAFVDETGQEVRLGDYFGGEKPVLLSMVYYGCPMLCPMTLNGLTSSLKALEWNVGDEFEVVVVSIDPAEGPDAAAEAKLQATSRYGRSGTETGWHFLTGDEADVRRLADAVGFRYQYDPERDEYAHAAGLTMVTPGGEVSRYFFGIEYPPKDLKLGLVETASGDIGSLVEQLLLYCFHYDPAIGSYEWSERAMTALRIAAVLTLLGLAGGILWMLRQEKRHDSSQPRTA